MKFDVIIGNPPYQKSDGGGSGDSAIPIYNKFIENAIKMNPSFISMIIPSRWLTGGRSLSSFREQLLNDKRMKVIIDYKNSKECFPSVNVGGGIMYFLWDKHYSGKCNYKQMQNNIEISSMARDLNQFDIFVRDNIALGTLYKILKNEKSFYEDKVSTRRPFNLSRTNEQEEKFMDYEIDYFKGSLKLYGNKLSLKKDSNISNGIAYLEHKFVNKNIDKIDKHKVIIPKAGGTNSTGVILPTPFYAEPNSICSQTYLVVDSFSNKKEALNLIEFIKTKFFRFLVSLAKNTHNCTRGVYKFVPVLPMDQEWTDEKLYKRYNLTQEEINYIEEKISPME